MHRCLLLLSLAAAAAAQTAPSIEQQSTTILNRALEDNNPDIRKQAVIALSLAGDREPFSSRLESMLEDKDVEVRLAAIASLLDVRTRRAIPALRKALEDNVPEVSFAAAKALNSLHDPVGKAALTAVLSRETKVSSSFFTKQKRDAMRMMHTPKTMFLFALKQGVGFSGLPGLGEGVASMQALLSDPGVSGRAAAALLLGKEADQHTVKALRDALSDKDWSVRAAAAHSLAIRNNPALLSDLEPLLADRKEAVRLRAAAACLRLEAVRDRTLRNGRKAGPPA